jgi:hypothetical protein
VASHRASATGESTEFTNVTAPNALDVVSLMSHCDGSLAPLAVVFTRTGRQHLRQLRLFVVRFGLIDQCILRRQIFDFRNATPTRFSMRDGPVTFSSAKEENNQTGDDATRSRIPTEICIVVPLREFQANLMQAFLPGWILRLTHSTTGRQFFSLLSPGRFCLAASV